VCHVERVAARVREGQAVAVAAEERDAEVALQALDLAGHSGLSDVHLFGGGRDGTELRDSQKAPQVS
jgi:hypothetical protein